MVLKKIAVGSVVSALILSGLIGCGSASNNDQGTALSLDRFALTDAEVPFPGGADDETAGVSGAIGGTVSVRNSISTQGVRVQRVFLSYFVPGASAQPPSTAVAINQILGPGEAASGEGVTPPTSTLPPGFATANASATSTINAVPASILTWMVFNRASLPELPFEVEITASVRGTTTAGDSLDTNAGTTTLTLTPDIIVPPGGASSSSASSSSASTVTP